MTRGYICLIDGKKVTKYAYLQSDAYLDFYGVEILQAIMDNRIDAWMDKQIAYNHTCYGADEPSPHFTIDWIKRTKNNQDWERSDFYSYTYEYSLKTGTLKVYTSGDLYVTVKREEYEKYLFYFKNDSAISHYLHYNPETMEYDYKKPIKKIIKNSSLEDLQQFFEESKKERLELENAHRVLAGHFRTLSDYESCYVYSKNFLTSDYYHSDKRGYQKKVPFIVEKPYRSTKWDVLVQLPYIRVPVASGFSSEKKAVEHIRSIIKQVGVDKLLRFGEVSNTLSCFYKENRYDELQEYISQLEESYQKSPWYIPGGSFTPKEIRNHYMKVLLKRDAVS